MQFNIVNDKEQSLVSGVFLAFSVVAYVCSV